MKKQQLITIEVRKEGKVILNCHLTDGGYLMRGALPRLAAIACDMCNVGHFMTVDFVEHGAGTVTCEAPPYTLIMNRY